MSRIISFVKGSLACTCLHLKRCIGWRLVDVEPSLNEKKKLDDKTNDTCAVISSYLVWRRSSMLVSLPIMLYSSVSGFIEVQRFRDEKSDGDHLYLTKLGTFLEILPSFAEAVLFLTVISALIVWHKRPTTSKLLMVGWILSTVMPLLPALVPLDYVESNSYEEDFMESCSHEDGYTSDDCQLAYKAQSYSYQIYMAIRYGIKILPLVLTIPSSAVRGSLRIRGLLPDSSLASWVIMISAPFYSLLVLVSLVFVVQMAGSFILVVGTLLLCSRPWLFVYRRELYFSVSNEENEKKIDNNHRLMLAITVVSFTLLIIWANTGNSFGDKPLGTDENSLMTRNSFFQFVFEGIGRTLVTTVVFTDALLSMTVTNWRHEHSRREDETTRERIEDIFHSLENKTSRNPVTVTLDTPAGEIETESDTTNESNDDFDIEVTPDTPATESDTTKDSNDDVDIENQIH